MLLRCALRPRLPPRNLKAVGSSRTQVGCPVPRQIRRGSGTSSLGDWGTAYPPTAVSLRVDMISCAAGTAARSRTSLACRRRGDVVDSTASEQSHGRRRSHVRPLKVVTHHDHRLCRATSSRGSLARPTRTLRGPAPRAFPCRETRRLLWNRKRPPKAGPAAEAGACPAYEKSASLFNTVTRAPCSRGRGASVGGGVDSTSLPCRLLRDETGCRHGSPPLRALVSLSSQHPAEHLEPHSRRILPLTHV